MAAKTKQKSTTADPPFLPPQWPASEVFNWPLAKIKPYPNNPKTHPKEQIKALAADMRSDGVTAPIMVDEDGVILYGHGRRLAAIEAGFTEYPVIIARGWSDQKKREVRIKDNTRPLMGGWDETLFKLEVGELRLQGTDLKMLSLDMTGLKFEGFGPTVDGADRGRLLELVNVTIQDPKHQPAAGSHYILSGRHHLFCASVIEDWPIWGPHLVDGSLFAPYPGVFVPFSVKAAKHSLVMVQPDPYIAGHILDRYQEVHGKKAIKEIAS